MRAGPAGPPDDDQIPDTMGRPSRPTAPLIHASVQTVVDVIVSPRVPTVDPVRGDACWVRYICFLIFECYRRRRFPQLLGYLPELRGNTFPPRGDTN